MRVLGIVSFLVLLSSPVMLLAQVGSNTSQSDGQGIQVENVSERGGFIGSGKPTFFVGVEELPNSSSTRSSTSATTSTTARRQAAQSRSPMRSTTSATAQRRPGMTSGMLQQGGTNARLIQSVSTVDVNPTAPSVQRPQRLDVEANLSRIQGIQDGQIMFTHSPTETTAVLSGSVASDWERRVAKQLLLLEPGINHVENMLNIR